MPCGGRKQNRGGIQEEDHRRRGVLCRTATRTGEMFGMCRTPGGRVNVESSDDSTWESGEATTPMDTLDGKRGQDIQDVLPNKGGTAAISSGRVPGNTGNEDGNAGALRALACPRHCGDAGGRKLPPPTVCQV